MAVIVTHDADQKAVVEFIANGPFGVEFVPRLILGRVVLQARHEADGAVDLQLGVLIEVGKSPTDIEGRPIEPDNGIEAGVVAARGYDAEKVKCEKSFAIPAELELQVHIAKPPPAVVA